MRQSTHHIHRDRSTNNHNALRRSAVKGTPFFTTTAEQPFFSQKPGATVQPKLTVKAPNDIYEKEADAMADRVIRMPDSQIQRQEEEEKNRLQRKPLAENITPFFQRKASGGGEMSQQTAASLQSTKGSGRALPDDTRNWMESRFGTDFSRVKVHTDSKAVQLSRELNAKAFTHGRDIYFNRGEFAPGTNEGKRLLAHELIHVAQQAGNIHKKEEKESDGTIQNPILGLKRGDGLDWGTWHLRPRVKILQSKLVEKTGHNIKVDGMFGPKTDKTLESFQVANGINPKQVVDPESADLLMKGQGQPKPTTPGIIPVNFTTPIVDSIKVIKTSNGAFSGFPIVKGVDLNKPQKFNETHGKGRVANVHQIAFHLKQGTPNEVVLIRSVDRVAVAGGKSQTKKGNDGPSAPTVVRKGANIVVSDGPGYFGPSGGAPPDKAFPVRYVARFLLLAVDRIAHKVIACIDYVVAIYKDELGEKNPLNVIGAEKKKIGDCKKKKV